MKFNPFFFRSTRAIAIAESIFATIIWASSFVFVKIIISDIGPLTIAGLRYFLAFLILLPFILREEQSLRKIPSRLGIQLVLIGIAAYTIGNGALFWGLKYLPATTTSFLMSISPILVLFAGVIFLKEFPKRLQIIGVVTCLVGSALFFVPGLRPGEPLGLALVGFGLLGFTAFSILGRGVARERRTSTIILTGIPFAVGGGILLLISIPVEGWPVLNQKAWTIILWLAFINTAFAYILYNHALKTITALEMNVILNLSPLGTAIIAWFILDESLALIQILGMVTVVIGVILVQVKGNRKK